eukprot:11170627-Lingulodinium_polyedra.AAC.1
MTAGRGLYFLKPALSVVRANAQGDIVIDADAAREAVDAAVRGQKAPERTQVPAVVDPDRP